MRLITLIIALVCILILGIISVLQLYHRISRHTWVKARYESMTRTEETWSQFSHYCGRIGVIASGILCLMCIPFYFVKLINDDCYFFMTCINLTVVLFIYDRLVSRYVALNKK